MYFLTTRGLQFWEYVSGSEDKLVWRGMAYDLPKKYKDIEQWQIFGTIPENIWKALEFGVMIDMSTLTLNVQIVYVPILYDRNDETVFEGSGFDCEESALDDGVELVQDYVKANNEWCYVKIEKRVIPIYGE